jgi:hypothetical protein
MIYWCLGMYGSASTWTFNVMQQLAGAAAPARPVRAHYLPRSIDAVGPDDAAVVVVKTHACPVGAALAPRAARIIITIRDPRDAVASLIAHHKATFDLALRATEATAQVCARFAVDPRATLLRFEDRFFERPETIARLATLLPGDVPPDDQQGIFQQTQREAIDGYIARLETLPQAQTQFDPLTRRHDTFDPATGWHKHHGGRKAETGRWRRELRRWQVEQVETRLAGWMARHGYTPAVARRPDIAA